MFRYFTTSALKSSLGAANQDRGAKYASKLRLPVRAAVRTMLTVAFIAMPIVTSWTHAASERGRVDGVVTDPTGAKVAGARVLLRSGAGVIAYQATTDNEGHFAIPNVAEGKYKVIVEAPGFSHSGDVSVGLRGGASERVTVRLEIAAVSDQLVVSATRT